MKHTHTYKGTAWLLDICFLCGANMHQLINNSKPQPGPDCDLITHHVKHCNVGFFYSFPTWWKCRFWTKYCHSLSEHQGPHHADPGIVVLTSTALHWPHVSHNAPSHTLSCRDREGRKSETEIQRKYQLWLVFSVIEKRNRSRLQG